MQPPMLEHGDEPQRQTHHYYYGCWLFPWGGWLCGVSLVAIGLGLVLQQMLPAASDAVWGGVLVALGIVVLGAAMRGSDAR